MNILEEIYNYKLDFVNKAKTLYGVTKGLYDSKVDGFVKLGKRFGLEREDIVIEGGQLPEITSPASNAPPLPEGFQLD